VLFYLFTNAQQENKQELLEITFQIRIADVLQAIIGISGRICFPIIGYLSHLYLKNKLIKINKQTNKNL
jgi:hypothetical protein